MDFDADGIEDFIIGERSGYANFFKRKSDGTLRATMRLKANGQEIDVGDNSSPQITDWNGDGLLDLLVCGDMQDGIRLYLNSGTLSLYKFTDYTTLKTSSNQEILYYRSQLRVVDLNQDGKQDLILADGLVPNSCFRFFENTGENDAPILADPVKLKYGNGTDIEDPDYDIRYCITDWNEDGGLDIVYSDYGDAPLYLLLGEVPTGIHIKQEVSKGKVFQNITLKKGYLSAQINLKTYNHIVLDIISADGRVVKTEDLGGLQAGLNRVGINMNRLTSGMYIIRCKGNGICIEMKRFLLIK